MDLQFSDVTEQRLLETYLACGSYPLFHGFVHYLECTSMIEVKTMFCSLLSLLLVSSERIRLGSLTTCVWVVADGMTEVSFRRLPTLLCLYC